jgi:hypothetical protein
MRFLEPEGKSSTILTLVQHPARASYGYAHCTDTGQSQTSYPYKMKTRAMTLRYPNFPASALENQSR